MFRAVNGAYLVFDRRLVIDSTFQTNDPCIFAAGPLTKFSRRYHSEQWYVCIFVRMYIFIRMCNHAYNTYVHIYFRNGFVHVCILRTYICIMYVYTCVRTYIQAFTNITYSTVHTYVYACYLYLRTCIHAYIPTYVRTCVYVCYIFFFIWYIWYIYYMY